MEHLQKQQWLIDWQTDKMHMPQTHGSTEMKLIVEEVWQMHSSIFQWCPIEWLFAWNSSTQHVLHTTLDASNVRFIFFFAFYLIIFHSQRIIRNYLLLDSSFFSWISIEGCVCSNNNWLMVLPQMHTANAHTTFGTLIYFDLAFFGIWFQHFKLKINCQFSDLDWNKRFHFYTIGLLGFDVESTLHSIFFGIADKLCRNIIDFLTFQSEMVLWRKKFKFLAENEFWVHFGPFQKFSKKILCYEKCPNPFFSRADTLG